MKSGARTVSSRTFALGLSGLLNSFQSLSPTRLWAGIFLFWTLFISGFVGFPGIQQAVRLNSLLSVKQGQIRVIKEDLRKLQLEALDLEKNSLTQQREIRRVLGYAASDELIFDYSSGEHF